MALALNCSNATKDLKNPAGFANGKEKLQEDIHGAAVEMSGVPSDKSPFFTGLPRLWAVPG
jgi:hypothetical protein